VSGLDQPFVQETFASNWIAPLGLQRESPPGEWTRSRPILRLALRQRSGRSSGQGSPRPWARPTRWRSAPARPRCTWRWSWLASGRGTRCWSPPSPPLTFSPSPLSAGRRRLRLFFRAGAGQRRRLGKTRLLW